MEKFPGSKCLKELTQMLHDILLWVSREFETWIGLGKNSLTFHLVIDILCGVFLYVCFQWDVYTIKKKGKKEKKSGLLLLNKRVINCAFKKKERKKET